MTSSSTATPSAAQTAVTVLEDGFALFKQSAVECLPLSVLAVAVGQWPQLTGLSHSSRPGAFLLTCIAAALGCWLLTLIVLRQAAMQSATPTPWRVSLRLATLRLPSLLLLVIAMLLIVVVGLAVLIVPGVYLAVAALPAFYLLIIEGLSVACGARWRAATRAQALVAKRVRAVVGRDRRAGVVHDRHCAQSRRDAAHRTFAVGGRVGRDRFARQCGLSTVLHCRRLHAVPVSSASSSA